MAKLNVENLTIVMKSEVAASPSAGYYQAIDDSVTEAVNGRNDLSVEIELAQLMLRKAIRTRNSALGASFAALKVAHEEVMTLRSVIADLELAA